MNEHWRELLNCSIAVPVEPPTFREPVAGKKNIITRQRRDTNAAAGGKRHYIIDYFVIVDFAIYNRCEK